MIDTHIGMRIPSIIPKVQRKWESVLCRSSRLLASISWRSWLISLSTWFSLVSTPFNLSPTCSRMPSTLASLCSAMSNLLYLIQIFFAQIEVTQDSCQSSLRNIFASVLRNGGISIPLGTPPDFIPTLCLAPELAPQLPQFSGKLLMGHGVLTVRRSLP